LTDVLSSNNVSSVPIPSDLNALATYPIGIVQQSRNPAVARAFMDFVTSPEGQAILARYGFLPA
jgi:molybdate transport system substrate-binding protein